MKAIKHKGKLYICNQSLIEFISEEIDLDMRRPGKTYSKFAKRMIRILEKYEKEVDTKEES